MILYIILLVLLLIISVLFIFFVYYIFIPSIKGEFTEKEPLVSPDETNYIADEEVEPEQTVYKAVVLCSCKKNFDIKPERFNKDLSCSIIHLTTGTGADCKFACIGLGDCASCCPQHAIRVADRTAVVTNLCNGCGRCVDVCPVGIIKLIPANTKSIVLCSNKGTDLTSCSAKNKEEKVEWKDKKGFKIWTYCYKILNRFKNKK